MIRSLIEWTEANGWQVIETDSFEDPPTIYEITGSAEHTFWEKVGFRLVERHPYTELQDRNKHIKLITTQE